MHRFTYPLVQVLTIVALCAATVTSVDKHLINAPLKLLPMFYNGSFIILTCFTGILGSYCSQRYIILSTVMMYLLSFSLAPQNWYDIHLTYVTCAFIALGLFQTELIMHRKLKTTVMPSAPRLNISQVRVV